MTKLFEKLKKGFDEILDSLEGDRCPECGAPTSLKITCYNQYCPTNNHRPNVAGSAVCKTQEATDKGK